MRRLSRAIGLCWSVGLSAAIFASGCSDDCDPTCGALEACIEQRCVPLPDLDAGGPAEADAGAPDAGDHQDAGEADASSPMVVSVTVTPTSAALISVNGSMPTVRFSVGARFSDGSTLAVSNPDLRVEPILLGAIDPATGTFTSNGRVGGEGRIVARVQGTEGSARITVRLEQVTILPGTSTQAPTLFSDGLLRDPAREADIVYPLDQAVMPQNVAPAEIQWRRSEQNDVFRITLEKPHVTAAIFATTDTLGFRRSWVADLATWRGIAQSEPGEWATITVDRWVAATNQAIAGTPVRVRFVRAALLGAVYYWDIQRGRIVRINDGTATREEFMPTPQLNCVGCHSVSPSGRYMAGRFGGGENVGGVLDLTRELTANPPPTVFPVTSTTARWWFSSWSPDESRLVVSVNEQNPAQRALQLLDPFRGQFVPPRQGTLPTGNVTHPAWSPDGDEIAYVANANRWGGENTTGDLWIVPVTGLDAFGTPRRVLTGTAAVGLPAGAAASYPTWSPDSAWLAFARGTSSRSENGQSALYAMKRDGSGLVRLDRASGGPNGTVSFQPRFAPFAQDGYFFLSFLSRRDYGNELAGTAGSSRQQIWVSAIKANPAPGEDPSEVPFWLPGQNPASLNISAYWAPRACRADNDTCTVDAECCGGDCAADPSGSGSICVPAMECRRVGEPCTLNEQCCDQQLCIGTCGGL